MTVASSFNTAGETGVGASAAGDGLGETAGVGEGDDTGSGAGAGDGDFPNNSVGRSKLSTVKRQSGVASSTVSATLDESTPVFRVTESPAVDTVRSYFPAPLVASVLIGSLLVFNDPIGLRHKQRRKRLASSFLKQTRNVHIRSRRSRSRQKPRRNDRRADLKNRDIVRDLLNTLRVTRVKLGAGSRRAETDLATFQICNVYKTKITRSITGGLVERGVSRPAQT
ncbi:unnamed protein product, partial [Vitis vinifera]